MSIRQDNFAKIKELMEFDNPTDFYCIDILKRKKDAGNEHMLKSTQVVDHFYIYSEEALDKYKDIIIDKCTNNNARAYFRVTKRDTEQVALEVLARTAMYISKKQYRSVRKVYAKVCGYTPGKNKKWIIDIDDTTMFGSITGFLYSKGIQYTTIPTVNGSHLILDPFDTRDFVKLYGDNELIHKDNATLLYSNFKSLVVDC